MKKASILIVSTLVALTAIAPLNADAHSGRTDASGCHNDRKSGGSHCHGSGSSSPSTSTGAEPSSPSEPIYSSPSSSYAAPDCSKMPEVDPWRLQKPVLMGNAKASYYYKGVVLAGDTPKVQAFINCYDLTTKSRPDYTTYRPIWAACQEIMGPGGPRGSQMVCVALDDTSRAADDRIYSKEYAQKVADKVFAWF